MGLAPRALFLVREADDVKIAQHFSAGTSASMNSRAREAGERIFASTGPLEFSAVRFTDLGFILSSDPSDESVGYFLSSV